MLIIFTASDLQTTLFSNTQYGQKNLDNWTITPMCEPFPKCCHKVKRTECLGCHCMQ